MKNLMKNKTIAKALSALMLLSTVQIPLLADIDDRIEYKLNRAFQLVEEIEGRLSGNCVDTTFDETFDYVVVGAGNAGCVIANRLSESGQYSVCVLEAGRDDARLPELLPEPSPADVPQPGDFQWGKYVRGGVLLAGALINKGFGDFWFYEDTPRPNGTSSTTYTRHAGWGGCTAHNAGINIRNAPFNWNSWAALGLTEWNGGTSGAAFADSPLIPLYKKIENRSQALFGTGFKLYDPSLPAGSFGGFDATYYGFDGALPIAYTPPTEPFPFVMQGVINTTLAAFNYPTTFVDLDYPPTAALGGYATFNDTFNFQALGATITLPGAGSTPDFSQNQPFAVYNFPLYGDAGFQVPSEFQDLNDPLYDPAALFTLQRASAATAYLYPAQANPNLTIKSEVLVTNLIINEQTAQGVEYLVGWNIYQTGRNPNTAQAGYGGTVGDARFNGIAAKQACKRRVFANKAVVLCAGAFNTPQILMLSGIGNQSDLEALGIQSVLNLPGVGQHLIDNHELFCIWEMPDTTTAPATFSALASFINPTDSMNGIPPAFEIVFVGGTALNENGETYDPFVQKGWAGLRNLPAIHNGNTRNTFHNILLDPTNVGANPAPIIISSASAPVAPTPPNTGPWTVTFTIPASTVSNGGFTIAGNSNPNYNGKFTAVAFNGGTLPLDTNVPGVTTITLAYPTNPGVYGGGVTTILSDPAFIPVMKSPKHVMGLLVEQEENNRSEGFVKLQSADPTVPPLVAMNYLSDPQDLSEWMDVMMNTVFPILAALQSTAPVYFQNLLVPSPADILFDGTVNFTSPADVDPAKLETYLLNYVAGHHAGGTCKMGLANDPMAVVDQKGAVFGIDNLYIADMSVVPVSVRWPNSTAYVIGEKIAADILAEA